MLFALRHSRKMPRKLRRQPLSSDPQGCAKSEAGFVTRCQRALPASMAYVWIVR